MPRYANVDKLMEHAISLDWSVLKWVNEVDISTAINPNVVARKKGKWIQRSDMPWYYYCSNCYRVISVASADQMEKFHAFCGTCGAYMKGES